MNPEVAPAGDVIDLLLKFAKSDAAIMSGEKAFTLKTVVVVGNRINKYLLPYLQSAARYLVALGYLEVSGRRDRVYRFYPDAVGELSNRRDRVRRIIVGKGAVMTRFEDAIPISVPK